MAQAQRKPGSGPAASDDGMKGLIDLFSRNPTPARVTMHVERGSVKNLGQVACRRWSDRPG